MGVDKEKVKASFDAGWKEGYDHACDGGTDDIYLETVPDGFISYPFGEGYKAGWKKGQGELREATKELNPEEW